MSTTLFHRTYYKNFQKTLGLPSLDSCNRGTNRERLLFEKNFFGPEKCGFYSREVTKRERLLMARVRYFNKIL